MSHRKAADSATVKVRDGATMHEAMPKVTEPRSPAPAHFQKSIHSFGQSSMSDTYRSEGSCGSIAEIPSLTDQLVLSPYATLKAATEVDAFFLVNPSSGGNQARSFMTSGIKVCDTNLVVDGLARTLTVRFFDMTEGENGNRPAYHAVKNSVDAGRTVITCACGGDGSVVWMTTEIQLHEIDDTNIFYAVIPYGTGNDFARAFGWEWANALQPFSMTTCAEDGSPVMKVNKLMETWFTSVPCLMDIWEIDLKLFQDGELLQVKGAEKKKVPVAVRNFKMFNYFSIGIDARIGVGFDRNRTSTQIGNKIVYMNEGVKKIFKNDFIPVDKWVHRVEERGLIKIGRDASAPARLLPGTKCLMALNVNSYGGGRQLWAYARKLGVAGLDPEMAHKLKHCKQKMGDKQLEWATCLHRSSLGLEQVGHGHTRRALKGKGDYKIIMNASSKTTDRCYFQVDGEFYQCTRPKNFTVKHLKQVVVLANTKSEFVCESNLVTAGV
eukprot:GHVH01003452.1.p1 GENE.GHVH01003452.1~~GHVH01003452.1.p1  ORF type:complete len:495 (-),score=69.49 GHVH01003452.1:1271-2755(-)